MRWGGTALGVAYVLSVVDPTSVKRAFSEARLSTVALGVLVAALGFALGAQRWRVLLRAYGARTQPPFLEALRLTFIGVFYNTYLPGGVAGDLLRGVATRDAFGEGGAAGATGSIAVVMIERALGLFGVVTLVGIGLGGVGPRVSDTGDLWLWSGVGAALAIASVGVLPLGRRLAPVLPGKLGEVAARLPRVTSLGGFAGAALLSLGTQLATVIVGWLFLRDLHAGTTLLDALFIVPLAAATVFLPITVGGAGAREAVFIALCGQLLAMPSGDALAASLLLWLTQLVCGAGGGLWQLAGRGRRS